MNTSKYINLKAGSVLDVGCNRGWLLGKYFKFSSAVKLYGVDMDSIAIAESKKNFPFANFSVCSADSLKFDDNYFDQVFMLEVLEHIPEPQRSKSIEKIRTSLRIGGEFILTVPHDGLFVFMDPNNFRIRFESLYKFFSHDSERTKAYSEADKPIIWHHHFKTDELLSYFNSDWEVIEIQYGGLLLFPMVDFLHGALKRLSLWRGFISKSFLFLAEWDYNINYGKASYGVMIVFRRLK